MDDIGYVYILQSIPTKYYYVGSTNDLEQRFIRHNNGMVKATKGRCPWELKFSQQYGSLKEARRIEYKLKRLKSKKIIEQIIDDKMIKLD